MWRYSYSCSFHAFAAVAKSSSNWDATVSLFLGHHTLFLLEKCRTREHFKQILAQMIRIHLIKQTFPMSRLIFFSAVSHPENVDLAILLFHHYTPQPNLYIYNTMISGLSFSSRESIVLYRSMLLSCIRPDKQTFLSLLKASRCLSEGKQIHGHAIVTGLSSCTYLQNSLIKTYSENERMDLAQQVFQKMPQPDSISWNVMIHGYTRAERAMEALGLFYKMLYLGFELDDFTIVSLLLVCGQRGDVRHGKSVHAWIKRREYFGSGNLIVLNALLDMYVKCEQMEPARMVFDGIKEKDFISWNTIISGYATIGEVEIAHNLFNKMPHKDIVSWNALLAGYAQKGDCIFVKKLFKDMLLENVRFDKFSIISLIIAAVETGDLYLGRGVHAWMIKSLMKFDAFLGSALIHMYSKCGSIERALFVFERVDERDVMIWTAMIAGLAFHGCGNKALQLFWEMQEDLMPNAVTFVAVLTACCHSGLINQGWAIFSSMKETYDIEPRVEHYGCLVDLLGRAGMINEARDVVDKMPMKPSASIWGAMLSACRAHGNFHLAETALRELVNLEPEKEGGYILLSNIYSACGKWVLSDNIRGIMESRGVKKIAGRSTVSIDGVNHEFVAIDSRHPRCQEIYQVLNYLNGYFRSTAEGSFQLLHQFSTPSWAEVI